MGATDAIETARVREGTALPGGYRVERLIALGGMAAVYRGRTPEGEPVAIKVMLPEMLAVPHVRERFVREGRAAARIAHAAIPRVHHDGVLDDGTVFLVIELLEGETVTQRLARRGYLPTQEVLAIADAVLDVLDRAHRAAVLHRDIKPDNVFLTRSGSLKLLDLGIARFHEEGAELLTHAGWALGTPAFMAPEQAAGDWARVDERTDLWAVGALVFAGLTGRPVHEATTPTDELVLAATQRAPALATVLPGVRASVASLVDTALSFERSSRFQSAAEMRAAVRAALGETDLARVWANIASDVQESPEPISKTQRRHDSGLATIVGRGPAPAIADVAPSGPVPRPVRAVTPSIPPPGERTRVADSAELDVDPELAALLAPRAPRPPRAGSKSAPEQAALRVEAAKPAVPRRRARIALAIAMGLIAIAAFVLLR